MDAIDLTGHGLRLGRGAVRPILMKTTDLTRGERRLGRATGSRS